MKRFVTAVGIILLLVACAQQTTPPITTTAVPTQTSSAPAGATTEEAQPTETSETEPTQVAPTATTENENVTVNPAEAEDSPTQPSDSVTQAPPTATSQSDNTDIMTPRPTEPSRGPINPDFSGEQAALSSAEQAAQGSQGYSGTRCRITVDNTCSCVPDTATAVFTFNGPNALDWMLTVSSGSTASYNMNRVGINSWQGALTAESGALFDVLVVFRSNGFDQQITTTIEGQQVICVNQWNR